MNGQGIHKNIERKVQIEVLCFSKKLVNGIVVIDSFTESSRLFPMQLKQLFIPELSP